MPVDKKEIEAILKKTQDELDRAKEKKIHEEIPGKIEKINLNSSWVKEFIEQIRFIYKMVFDSTFSMSREHKLVFLAALMYFLIPTDLIADFIPVAGLLDDAMVLKLVWKSLQDEINRYKNHLVSQYQNPPETSPENPKK